MIWSLINIEKSNITILIIKDRKKIPIVMGKFNLELTSKGYRPYNFKIIEEEKGEYFDFVIL